MKKSDKERLIKQLEELMETNKEVLERLKKK